MSETQYLSPADWIEERPFTHPRYIDESQESLRYMARQLCLLLEYQHFSAEPPHVILFKSSTDPDWYQRIVLAQPERLQQEGPLTIVGFFGQKRPDGDKALAHEFDRTLVAEIPEHDGLLSYSTLALGQGNYANLVVFSERAARDHWSTSKAHAQAVRRLAPNYYQTVTIFNGLLPGGIMQHDELTLVRAKYYDYQSRPRWQAVREIC